MAKMTAPLTAAAWLTANCTPEDIISLGTLGMTRMDAFAAAKVREFAERAIAQINACLILCRTEDTKIQSVTRHREYYIEEIRALSGKETP